MRRLLQYCDQYGLDYQEIDDTLTYWENKKHLKSIVKMLRKTGDTFELARIESLQQQYMKEHPLHWYASALLAEGQPRDLGKIIPAPKLFSLQNISKRRKMLSEPEIPNGHYKTMYNECRCWRAFVQCPLGKEFLAILYSWSELRPLHPWLAWKVCDPCDGRHFDKAKKAFGENINKA